VRGAYASPEKFKQTLQDFSVSEEVTAKIYDGFGKLVSKTPKKVKAALFRQALTIMNEELPKEQVQEILEANACCKSGARERASKEFARIQRERSIPERLELISARPYLNMSSAEPDTQGRILVHEVSLQQDGKFACACPTVSKVQRGYEIPREYCYCCGGHFRYHYEIMLGVKLKLVEIVDSPHGSEEREPCAFRFEIVD